MRLARLRIQTGIQRASTSYYGHYIRSTDTYSPFNDAVCILNDVAKLFHSTFSIRVLFHKKKRATEENPFCIEKCAHGNDLQHCAVTDIFNPPTLATRSSKTIQFLRFRFDETNIKLNPNKNIIVYYIRYIIKMINRIFEFEKLQEKN